MRAVGNAHTARSRRSLRTGRLVYTAVEPVAIAADAAISAVAERTRAMAFRKPGRGLAVVGVREDGRFETTIRASLPVYDPVRRFRFWKRVGFPPVAMIKVQRQR